MARVYDRMRSGTRELWLDFTDGSGRRVRVPAGTDNRRQAELKLARVVAEVEEGRFSVTKRRALTLATFCDGYLTSAAPALRSERRVKQLVAHLVEALGRKRMMDIRPSDVERYRATRLRVAAVATVNRELAQLKRLYNLAMGEGLVDDSPFRGSAAVKLTKERNERTLVLSTEQCQALVTACIMSEQRMLAPLVTLALNTGARRGELLGLRWHDVNLEARALTFSSTKEGRSRQVGLNAGAVAAVGTLMVIQADAGGPSSYLFAGPTGEPLASPRRAFLTACRAAKLPESFRFHDLRHTFAAHWVMKGGDLVSLQRVLGHSDLKLTQRYANVSQSHSARIIDTMVLGCVDLAPNLAPSHPFAKGSPKPSR